jgi:hypothetical protein
MSAAVYGYQDRYKKFPGDDNDAATRWTNPATKSGDGNGAVGAAGQATVIDCAGAGADGENCRFWQHLRLSGFIGGDSASRLAPQNAAGGILQVQNGALGLSALTICSTNLSGKIANAIDAQFDDGRPNTGQVRGVSGVSPVLNAAPTDTAYVDDGSTVYAVCKTL